MRSEKLREFNFLKYTTGKFQSWNLNLNLFNFRAKDLIMH